MLNRIDVLKEINSTLPANGQSPLDIVQSKYLLEVRAGKNLRRYYQR
jgi:hypothetical protein